MRSNSVQRWRGVRLVVVVSFAAMLLVPAAAAPVAAPLQEAKINGMTVSTPRGSAEWGKDHMVPTITDLKGLGVNWIQIHPYARIERNGEVRWRGRGYDGDSAPDWLRRPIEEAHRQGVKIFIKPHLAHWGNYSWRGEIAYEDEAERERFFRTYTEWIRAIARFSHDADAFSVGTELDRTVQHERQWREVIGAVREEYSGPLTYAANWTDYQRVPFWDALDAIGIQAYFPVLEGGPKDDATVPAQEEFDAGWERIMAQLQEFSHQHDKIVVFTELGYNNSWKAPYEPWDFSEVGGINADQLQARCMQAALAAIAGEPTVVGAFLWKWFPGDYRPRDFAMSDPAIRKIIAQYWRPRAAS